MRKPTPETFAIAIPSDNRCARSAALSTISASTDGHAARRLVKSASSTATTADEQIFQS